jgi:hypothetical protein
MDWNPRTNFYSVVTAGILDILNHGFDTAGRVEEWERKIRAAAEASLVPEPQMTQMLRDGLSQIYERLIEKGEIARYHQGVSRFTLDKIKPELRKLLDQRIMASANLIKLNRRQSIDKTLSRFSGWATSIPKGGTKTGNKAQIKSDIRKALTKLPFEERRVLIDQGHKLTAAISETVAVGGKAIAAKWRSNWKQPGYDYREDHKDRDQNVYLLRDTWATERGLVKPGNNGYYDKITRAGEEPFCRCYIVWIYALRDLPDDMLTVKGKNELDRVRAELAK